MTETTLQFLLRYTLTQKDQWRYYQYMLSHLDAISPLRKGRVVAFIFCEIIALGVMAYNFWQMWMRTGAVPWPLVVFLVIMVIAGITPPLISSLFSKTNTFYAFRFGTEQITYHQGSQVRVIRRQDIYTLTDAIEYIYIHTKTGFLIIPKRAFATISEAQAYYEQMAHWWRGEVLTQEGVWPPRPQI